MLSNITIGRYYHKNSLIHFMHPFVKVLATFLYVMIVVLFKDLFFLFLLLLFVLLVALMSKIPLLVYGKSIWSLKWFIVSIIAINLLLKVEIIDLVFTVFRLILIVFYSSLLTLTTSPNQLAKGLEMFMKPLLLFKIPVKNISLSLVHAIRFIPVVLDTANSIVKAQRSRATNRVVGFSQRIGNAFQIIVPCFIKSLQKAETISIAMEQRLYNLNQSRTYYNMPKLKLFDLYFLTVHLILFGAIIYKLVVE